MVFLFYREKFWVHIDLNDMPVHHAFFFLYIEILSSHDLFRLSYRNFEFT